MAGKTTKTDDKVVAAVAALTADDVANLAALLADTRAAGRDKVADALATGDYVVACMTGSGRVMSQRFDRWHAKVDAGDLWGLGYQVANAASDYQARGAACGYQRSYADAVANLAALGDRNGKQVIRRGTKRALPGYVVHKDDLPALTDALRLAYGAWLAAADAHKAATK